MRFASVAGLAALLLAPSLALADEPPSGAITIGGAPAETRDQVAPKEEPWRPRDAREASPLIGSTVSAFGAKGWSAGAAGWAGFVGQAKPLPGTRAYEPGGGARLWASPIDRVTVLVEMDRAFYGDAFSPAVTGMVRIAGDRRRGWAIGAGLTYRAESFAELGGELEGALHASFARAGFHSDLNLVAGGALEDEAGGEADGEVKLRLGYDVTSWMRVGADGRFRHRLAGDKTLPGGRVYDMRGGAEVLFGYKNFFWALAAGPTTVGVVRDTAWTGTGTFGVAVY